MRGFSQPLTAIGRKWICALVRRARTPGCKFDHTPVLEGEEGIRKSALVAALCPWPEYFSDETILDKPGKERQELVRGKWVYELAELAGIKRAGVDDLKSFLTRTEDRGRPAYGRRVIEQKRRTVFAGTTNDQEYLTSQSGNRRWWPIGWLTEMIDVDGFVRDRDQLFAEAVAVEPGEELWLSGALKVAVMALQDQRRVKDAWEDLLAGFEHPPCPEVFPFEDEWRVHTRTLWKALGLSEDKLGNAHYTTRLSRVMKRMGWEKAKNSFRCGPRSGTANGYIKKRLFLEGPKVVTAQEAPNIGAAKPSLAEVVARGRAKMAKGQVPTLAEEEAVYCDDLRSAGVLGGEPVAVEPPKVLRLRVPPRSAFRSRADAVPEPEPEPVRPKAPTNRKGVQPIKRRI
jgi:hypothetical protein